MRKLNGSLCSVVFMSALLAPAVSMASEPHSWCVTGAPMVRNGSTDSTTNAVIASVCDQSAYSSCCATSGRWSLACVQKGADHAKQNNLSGGDYCGRYAWAQAPVNGTQQYYPRDFNLFATSGSVNGLRDIDGPVAANGDVNISYFHLNLKRREPVALVAKRNVGLYSGTVNGSVSYGGSYGGTSVTYVDASRPTAASSPAPIDFASALTKLNDMSQALKRYDSKPATKSYSTVTFAGTDPELNVFSIDAAMLTGTTTYTFNVPAGSTVIVNVSGTNPTIQYAGFGGSHTARKLLWNFPDATSLVMKGIGFPGSILAPKAAANLQNGNIAGTVVVASALPGNVELYTAPFQIPSCTGGLCLDPTWSTSGDTPNDDRGNAADVGAEAGFLEIAGGNYIAEGHARTSPKHRIWYSFQPAKTTPKTKPLAVLFNGGPGSGTTPYLFSFNTGNMTLDPQVTGTAKKIVSNPQAWTQFANLLYIDAPATGFSYPVANDDGTQPDIGNDLDRDSGIFARVVLRFLKRHPALLNNRVVIVGESYGGTRATLMLQYIYDYGSLINSSSPYQDVQLSDELKSYFAAALGTQTPTGTQIATKFGHQVLIEPVVVGDEQDDDYSRGTANEFPLTNCISTTCMTFDTTHPRTCDPYNCDKGPDWSDKLTQTAATNLTNVAVLSSALGVNAKTIEWMKASSRTLAYGRNDGAIIPNPTDMISTFGALGADDNYLVLSNSRVLDGYGNATSSPARKWYSPGAGLISGTDFVKHLRNGVSTFITITKFDWVVWSPAIPYGLEYLRTNDAGFAGLISSLGYSKTDASSGLARPGAMWVNYFPTSDSRKVVMPYWYASGHTVPMRTPAELLADVQQWYAGTPH